MDPTLFPARLKEIRKAKRMTQQDLADAAGVDRATVNRWEQGTTIPNWVHITALCAALEVSCEAFAAPPKKKKTD